MSHPESIYQEVAENSTSLVYRRSFYKAYNKQYSSNLFGDTTIKAGTRIVDRMIEEKKTRWGLQTTQPTRGGAVTAVWQSKVKIVSTPPASRNGARFTGFFCNSAMRTRCMTGTAHKIGQCRD